jgi:hypothetical protein
MFDSREWTHAWAEAMDFAKSSLTCGIASTIAVQNSSLHLFNIFIIASCTGTKQRIIPCVADQ